MEGESYLHYIDYSATATTSIQLWGLINITGPNDGAEAVQQDTHNMGNSEDVQILQTSDMPVSPNKCDKFTVIWFIKGMN